jgi:DNA mismatch endonuclease (patch repair protein)
MMPILVHPTPNRESTNKQPVPNMPVSGNRSSRKRRRPAVDIITPSQRSALMARIRGRDTGPELSVRRLLHGLGYRFRLHVNDLPGRPDIAFRSKRIVIFVHGCFWHRHNCGLAYSPKTRPEFWQKKFDQNIKRDKTVHKALKRAGWRVIVVWECEVERLSKLTVRLTKLLGAPGVVRTDFHSVAQTRVRAKPARR